MILAALIGAITWNLITWYGGIPSSSSHALIGGLAGAAVARAGLGSLVPAGLAKVALFIVLSPLLGLALAFGLMLAVLWIFRRASPGRVDRLFRRLQLVSAAFYSLGHGTNDAQKTMGIIAGLLFATGHLGPEFTVPLWVILSAHAAIGLGTLAGGWRIVKTMGMGITRLRPVGGLLRGDRRVAACSSAPRWPGSRSARRTRSPAPSSAWVRRPASPPCAGASRGGSSGPGSSRSRRRRSSPG